VLNDNNLLNLARLQDRKVASSAGSLSLSYCDLSNFQITELPAGDSALISCIHYLGAADPDPNGIQLSANHYWRFGGIVPQGLKAKVTLSYRGAADTDLDHDLTNMPEDSLTLVWRPRPGVAWGQYPYYKKIPLSNNDGNGFIRIDTLLMGDYAFAAGSLPLATGLFDLSNGNKMEMSLYPNPTSAQLTVQAMFPAGKNSGELVIHDAIGQLVKRTPAQITGGLLAQTLDVSTLHAGIYFLKILDENGMMMAVEKFIKE
jgi:hypothetical protein